MLNIPALFTMMTLLLVSIGSPCTTSIPLDSVDPKEAAVHHFDSTRFLPWPGGCDAILSGGTNGQTFWGGCTTNNCANPPAEQCQAENTAWGTRYCRCEDIHGNPTNSPAACCYAEVGFADGGEVDSVNCYRNGCDFACQVWLYWEGEFYPCNCPPGGC